VGTEKEIDMFIPKPLPHKTKFIDLPLSRLHILEVGQGEPLIMVPATISELENWVTLAQFMAQWFHVYFFELPGHGQSEPFEEGFSSHRVAEMVGQLADALGLTRFNLMGFSFGGILAMRTFKLLSPRIDRLMLIAPCLGHPTLPFSASRLNLLRGMNQLLGHPVIQGWFFNLIHDKRTVSIAVNTLKNIGQLEDSIPLKRKLLTTQPSTLAVLNAQVNEILTTRFDTSLAKHKTPCYFAMSIHDPLLRFDKALGIIHDHFENVSTVRLSYPFHQPPVAFTYEELNRDFYETVNTFMSTNRDQRRLA